MATVRDVAKKCGYSLGTVSNVLNGRDESLDPAIKAEVLAAVRDLGYRPAPAVPRRGPTSTQNIGVILNDIVDAPLETHGYYAPVLDGIFRATSAHLWSATFFSRQMLCADIPKGLRRYCDGRCEGLLLAAPEPDDPIVAALIERGTPFVVLSSYPEDPIVSSVVVDDRLGARLAADHLVEMGHRRIAYVSAGFRNHSDDLRRVAFLDRLEQLAVPRESVGVIEGGNRPERYAAVADYLASLDRRVRPTALFCWNDELALGLMRQLVSVGLRVPEDLSIVGFDGTWESRASLQPITTVRQPLRQIGEDGVRVLIDHALSHTTEVAKVVLQPELSVGATVARIV